MSKPSRVPASSSPHSAPAGLERDPSDAERSMKRVAAASMIGTAVENYDFFIYGTAAALVFNTLFFPGDDPAVATIATFAVFATGFLARPLGGAILGHFGDRIGRKAILVLTLLMMGIATVAIGLLPTHAAIGVWAPILLVALRLIQGLAAGGEWAGAALLTVEHAPAGRRGFYGGFTQVAIPAAFVLANLVFLVLTATLTDQQLVSWGWRVPFLLSTVLIVAGLIIRSKVEETPAFTGLKESTDHTRAPFLAVWRRHTGAIVLTALAVSATTAIGYIKNVYVLSYATHTLGVDRSWLVAAIVGNAVLEIVLTMTWARWSDRIGRKTVFVIGGVLSALWAFPFVLLLDTASVPLIALALVGTGIGSTAMFAPLAALLAEKFSVEVRYTGASMGYQIGSILGGGFAPLIAAALFAATGSTLSIAAYMVVLCLISLGAIQAIGETRARTL
ncbi:MAG TPA: MFS transporter [Amycolatopsis sp.]|nr:MFS transporter [Amycolatopsis sp.]